MASSRSSALWDGRTTDHKEMAAIAADRLAGRQPEDDDVPMENMVVGDLLLPLQVLLEEMVVVGSVGLRLPALLLTHLPHPVHILGTGLADGHGAMHRRGWRGGGGWLWIVDYQYLHWDIIVLWLPAG